MYDQQKERQANSVLNKRSSMKQATITYKTPTLARSKPQDMRTESYGSRHADGYQALDLLEKEDYDPVAQTMVTVADDDDKPDIEIIVDTEAADN